MIKYNNSLLLRFIKRLLQFVIFFILSYVFFPINIAFCDEIDKEELAKLKNLYKTLANNFYELAYYQDTRINNLEKEIFWLKCGNAILLITIGTVKYVVIPYLLPGLTSVLNAILGIKK